MSPPQQKQMSEEITSGNVYTASKGIKTTDDAHIKPNIKLKNALLFVLIK